MKKRGMKKRIFLSVVLLFSIFSLKAQYQEEIDSGRPGNAISVFSVGKNVFQLETGMDYLEEHNSFKLNSILRYGISERIDLIAGMLYDFSNKKEKIEMISFGGKANIFEGDGILPSTGFQLTFNLSNSINQIDYSSILFIMGYSFNDNLSYTFNFGANIDLKSSVLVEEVKEIKGLRNGVKEERGVFVEGVYAFNLSYKLTDKISVFVEPYGSIDKYTTPKIKINFNSGISYLINKDLKIDLLSGKGINVNNDWGVSGGISWRIGEKRG